VDRNSNNPPAEEKKKRNKTKKRRRSERNDSVKAFVHAHLSQVRRLQTAPITKKGLRVKSQKVSNLSRYEIEVSGGENVESGR